MKARHNCLDCHGRRVITTHEHSGAVDKRFVYCLYANWRYIGEYSGGGVESPGWCPGYQGEQERDL